MDNIDYKKLLEICMADWFECEGGCWDGHMDDELEEVFGKLSLEETKAVEELHDKCYKRHIDKYG